MRTNIKPNTLGLKKLASSIQNILVTLGIIQAKQAQMVSVKDFGAVGNGVTNDAAAFQNAINALPVKGGTIYIPDGSYVINTGLSWGTKSILWNIGPGTVFSGVGALSLYRMLTNPAQVAVGPYIRSSSTEPSPAGGGIAAFNVEMIQPPDYVGQSVAVFFGAVGSSTNPASNVWTMNPLIRVEAGARGTYQGIELDVDCFSTEALVKGLSINGAGPANPDVALEIIRTGESRWERGVDLNQCILGLRIRGEGLIRGVVIGDVAGFVNTLISGKQLVNGADSVVLQRATDVGPTGFFLRMVDAAGTGTLLSVDALGQLTSAAQTIKSDQSAGFIAEVVENSSTASVTTKTVTRQVKGRDTANGLKVMVEEVTTPSNSNLISASHTLRTRTNDAMADTFGLDAAGNVLVMRVGAGLRVKEGANAKQGVATLTAGAVTVPNTSVTASSRIFATSQNNGVTGSLRAIRNAGVGFTITSSNAADAGEVAYEIFEPA